jgi:hypothetical protein
LGIPGIADAAAVANSQRFFLADYAQAITDFEPDLTGCASTADAAKSAPQCFVSTAAYGSSLHPYVEELRLFRDRHLQRSSLGKWLVERYYKNSPTLAVFIESRAEIKTAVRFLLAPLIWLIAEPLLAFAVLSGLTLLIFLPFRWSLVFKSHSQEKKKNHAAK